MIRFVAVLLVFCEVALSSSFATEHEIGDESAKSDGNQNVVWAFRLPSDKLVAFNGVANSDTNEEGSGNILYPAPNIGGFIAALVTHGILVDLNKRKKKSERQANDNKVLSAYYSVLERFTYRDLMERSLGKISKQGAGILIEFDDRLEQVQIIEGVPTFAMTQDQQAIILDHHVTISYSGRTNSVSNSIRVLSLPVRFANEDISLYWLANDGEKLKSESADLVALSLEIAFDSSIQSTQLDERLARTIRYREGTVDRFERGQVLSEDCGRMLIRTLRGTLLSVAAPANSQMEPCRSPF